jgi:5-methylcytosine-specific restriction protein B
MRDGSYVAVGWPELSDLSAMIGSQNARSELRRMLEQHYPNTPQAIGRSAAEICRFLKEMDEGDVVVAANGATILGVGKVAPNSQYRFQPDDAFPHRRAVTWLDHESWNLPQQEALRSTFRELRMPENLVAIERRILGSGARAVAVLPLRPVHGTLPRLFGVGGRIQAILERKSQAILYGPPGTGKTYWAERTANDLAAYRTFGQPYAGLDTSQRASFDHEAYVRMCTFHPAYGYEDFLEGYRPQIQGSQLVFSLQDGAFKRLCNDAARNLDSDYYLIIDEINRGDIPRIFGELLTIIEKSKRGRPIHLAVSGTAFQVPSNVYLIGTMNTADRSIALLDKALRRRFGFVECMPEPQILSNIVLQGIPLGPWLDAVNQRIRQKVGRDARNLQIGHSYLMEGERPLADFPRFAQVLQDEIIPLLEEYCYEDYSSLAEILGTGLVDVTNQAVRNELFDDARRDDLVQALLEPYPEIATSRQAVASESASAEEEDDEASATGEGAR